MKKRNLNDESHRIWEELGLWWDENVEEGDFFHKTFIFPYVEKLLALKGGETILDAGCGNGALSRRMAKKGADVLGIDFSSTLIGQARKRNPEISYEEIDLTNKDQLEELSKRRTFDRIVCSMVLHNMPDIQPFFSSLQALLKPQGSFIFSLPHPCFNSSFVIFEPSGNLTIKGYIKEETSKFRSKPGQPIEQLVFHRPMQTYIHLLFAQGMVLNGFEEPCVDPKILPKASLWSERPEIPPTLIMRGSFATVPIS